MKKIIKHKMVVIGSAVILGVAAQSAFANSGSIDFEGSVSDSTCTVAVNGTTGKANVKLPTVSNKLLDAADKTAGRTLLNFQLSGCTLATGVTKASVYFADITPQGGTSNINTKGRLDNTDTAGAKNVDLQLLDSKLTPMNLASGKGAQGGTPVDFIGNTASIRHFVEYIATAPATPGTIKSSIGYEIDYE